MDGSRIFHHPTLNRVSALVGAAIVLLAILGALALDSRWLGVLLIHRFATDAKRSVRIDGAVDTHLFSLAPRLSAEKVTIGNPPWMRPGIAAHIGRITLYFRWSSLHSPLELRALAMRAAAVSLIRDATGRSNWQWSGPGTPISNRPPMIHGLSVPDAEVRFNDERLHLHFAGKVSAGGAGGASGRQSCRVEGTGELNGRAVRFRIDGDSLAAARRSAPYHFAFDERSSGSHLTGSGILPRPFDVTQLEARFQAQGEDLKDLYFLTGVSLTETGAYHLTGALERRGARLTFRELMASFGQSDMSGNVLIESKPNTTHIDAKLRSNVLRLQDLGTQAAGRASASPSQAQLLLSATSLGLERFRASNADVWFDGHRLALERVELRDVGAQIALGHGAILVRSLSAALAAGKLSGELRIDLRGELPTVAVDLDATDVDLAKLAKHSAARGPPPLEGPLAARLTMSGRGDSLHAIAATADGQFTAVVPYGAIRASIADLAGLDFIRLMGLRVGTSSQEATVHCAIASLRARDGTLNAERLMIDIGTALITGHGEIHLGSEALDLNLHDEPTHVRLLGKRLPLQIGGTLKHPSVSVEGGHALARVGATAALGALLAPVDGLLHRIKPDLIKNSDCAAVLGEGEREGVKLGADDSPR